MSEQKINVKLLRRVKRHILEEPRRLEMMRFVAPSSFAPKEDRPPCGTLGCIAGWAVMLTDGTPKRITEHYYEGVPTRAAELLGLGGGERDTLFYLGNWPSEFREAYRDAETKLGEAQITARRIEHFIKTKGAE